MVDFEGDRIGFMIVEDLARVLHFLEDVLVFQIHGVEEGAY